MRRGEVKIMDFGIARMRNEQRITSHGKSVGTLEYMAPEQIQGQEGDERTDVYAVGNILYEMLCGTIPFQSETDYQLMKDKLEKQPVSIIRENPTVPLSFEKIIFKALQRQPNKRYKSALELKNAIEKCLGKALLDQSKLTEVLQASQVFTEPQKDNEIISVSKILSQAKSITGRFKVPNVSKINRPVIILGLSMFMCAILLIWGGGETTNTTDELPEPPKITLSERIYEPKQEVVEQNTGSFEETPSEMYQRIAEPPTEKARPNKKNSKVKKSVIDSPDSKSSNETDSSKSLNESEPIKQSENIDENEDKKIDKTIEESHRVPRIPVDVPAGQSISVTLMEDLSSEKVERDGKVIRLRCNENVMAENRIIIRKGAVVLGKIVDCIPSTERGEKALIGFVIQKVEAVDGSKVKLRSKRFRLFADVPGKPISYRSGQTFEATLKRGKVQ